MGRKRWLGSGGKNMMLPKAMGGMRFRDMRAFKQVLLSKKVSRLLDTPDSLCARLLRAKYYLMATYSTWSFRAARRQFGKELFMDWIF